MSGKARYRPGGGVISRTSTARNAQESAPSSTNPDDAPPTAATRAPKTTFAARRPVELFPNLSDDDDEDSSRKISSQNGKKRRIEIEGDEEEHDPNRKQARSKGKQCADEAVAEEEANEANENEDGSQNEPDTMRILLATDLHIGYMEKDQIRQMDTFQTLDEILSIAKKQEVDFILLGGDLFHENKPSRFALYNTSLLFRRYCFGDRPCAIEFLSDQSINFPDLFSQVNYQDPNFNVAIPVFSIHGNHDDPAGEGGLSAMDLLHITGLVNYFGKQPEIDDITVHPILLKKGSTRLALYGIGNVRDERLHRCFNKHRVKLMRPAERSDDWFNLMVLHQNRVARGASSYIPENYLASFLDLVLWGHEHDCRIDPEKAVDNDFYITQPGSSVATSLIEGEAIPKHVGILSIQGREFTIEKIRLKTVRPFVTDEVILGEVEPRLRPTDQKGAARFLTDTINEMIQRAKNEYREVNRAENQTDGNAEISDAEIPLPLVRLKVEYSGGYTTFNPQRFGQAFVGKVANPKDILVFHRKREMNNEKGPGKAIVEEPDLEALLPAKMSELQVEDLVNEYLEAQKLEVLAENAFGDAVRVFVDKEEVTAIKEFFMEELEETQKKLKQTWHGDEDDFSLEVENAKQERTEYYEREVKGRDPSERPKRKKAAKEVGVESGAETEPENDEPIAPATRGRGRGRGKASTTRAAPQRRGAGTGSKGRRKKDSDEDDRISEPDKGDSMDEDLQPPKKKVASRGRGRGRGSATSSSSTSRRQSPLPNDDELDKTMDSGSNRWSRSQSKTTGPRNTTVFNLDDDEIEESKPSLEAPASSGSKRRLPESITGSSQSKSSKSRMVQSKLNFSQS